jgi:hypothetical protein
MSKKHFSWLLIVTVVVAALVLLVPGKTSRESSFEKHAIVPGLAAVVNELDYLRLTAGGGEIIATLERSDAQWLVLEASSYPADWARLKALLSDLSRAEVIEEKTSNPEFYARLGVEDISTDDAAGILIQFAEQAALPAVIVGNEASSREGQYLRLQGEDKSALIDRKLDVPRERSQWLERTIIDVAESEVVEASITHPDGEVLAARKVSADGEDLELLNIPDGREIKSVWSVNSMGSSLAALNLEDVVPDSEVDWADAVVFSLLTADGLRVNADLVVREDEHWIRLQASAEKSGSDEAGQEDDVQFATSDDASDRVRQINSRVKGWAYRIPKHKFDTLTRRMSDMLKAEETPSS